MTDTTDLSTPSVRRFHPSDAGVRLVCFPHAGGAASYFFPVSRQLSQVADVLAIQYPGRQERRREPFIGSVTDLADVLVEELRLWADRPLALFGHSMGALVAFEVARRLEHEGIRPASFFASGRAAPSYSRDEGVHRRSDEDLIAKVKELGGTAGSLLDDPDVMDMLLPVIRNDYRAVETYRLSPGPPLACPLVALTGDVDPQVSLEEAQAWRTFTTGKFDLYTYSGGHFFLDAHAASVLGTIRTALASVQRF
ncbi:thioesterase II family protein [Streptomyces sp. CRN 30]|uniref:thioesterase II family protein n=1 Tax=Streptomyces sp. CRN 30 TaxID=3075613 RepID=UPI002A7FD5F4|nr:alpha/beta fold hydrolase [Streptomyces sp. CRN 30]